MSDKTLLHAQQQMLMKRPWDVAEPESVWEITGVYPNSRDSFTQCLAITLPQHVTGSEKPLFVFVGALSLEGKPVDPAWITYRAYYERRHPSPPSFSVEGNLDR